MADVGEQLREFFHQHPYAEHATSEIIKAVYPDEYGRIKAALHDPLTDRESRLVAKRHKGQLHRRILYHLNRLEAEGVIAVSQTKGKGEKCYVLNQQQGRKPQHQRIPHAPMGQPLLRLEHYVQRRVITSYDPRGWHSRLNAVLLDTVEEDTVESLHARIASVSKHVNDVIGIYAAEQLLVKEDLDRLSKLLRQLDIDTRDNERSVCLLIDLTKVSELKYTEDFFDAFALLNPANVKVVLCITKKFLDRHQRLMKHIIRRCSEASIKLNLHDLDVHEAPIIVGNAGVYTLQKEEWRTYLDEVRGKTIGICVGQVSVGVDVHRFFQERRTDKEFRQFILKLGQALVESSTEQRKRADAVFADINRLNKKPHEFFRFSTSYIRLWNYDWQERERPHFIDLLSTAAEELAEFCRAEETIFKSCGIPIRFKATLASMFSKFDPSFCSERRYSKVTVLHSRTLQDEEMRSFIKARERIFKLFDSNDRIRIFRATPCEPDDVLEEIKEILKQHDIPNLTYDFAERKADMTLSQFMT
ncbi:hypothetical protein JXA12_04330 [Candidatus Woesearchaeota archaeon]|nr:hypothetical protein [Candidatus Woesearchaeota archaeon]